MATIATELPEAKRDERGRRIAPAAEREALLRAYPESGPTQKAFAKKQGIKYPTFVSWVQAQRRQVSLVARPCHDKRTAPRFTQSTREENPPGPGLGRGRRAAPRAAAGWP
jgi:hypothetical protein